jgi:hypothetical protein
MDVIFKQTEYFPVHLSATKTNLNFQKQYQNKLLTTTIIINNSNCELQTKQTFEEFVFFLKEALNLKSVKRKT